MILSVKRLRAEELEREHRKRPIEQSRNHKREDHLVGDIFFIRSADRADRWRNRGRWTAAGKSKRNRRDLHIVWVRVTQPAYTTIPRGRWPAVSMRNKAVTHRESVRGPRGPRDGCFYFTTCTRERVVADVFRSSMNRTEHCNYPVDWVREYTARAKDPIALYRMNRNK